MRQRATSHNLGPIDESDMDPIDESDIINNEQSDSDMNSSVDEDNNESDVNSSNDEDDNEMSDQPDQKRPRTKEFENHAGPISIPPETWAKFPQDTRDLIIKHNKEQKEQSNLENHKNQLDEQASVNGHHVSDTEEDWLFSTVWPELTSAPDKGRPGTSACSIWIPPEQTWNWLNFLFKQWTNL